MNRGHTIGSRTGGAAAVVLSTLALLLLTQLLSVMGSAADEITTNPKLVSTIPRATFIGLHIGLSEDSTKIIFKQRAKRQMISEVDSLVLIESDSMVVFGQPAYIQAQLLHGRIRTLVITFHPLAGERYLNVRDMVDQYLMRLFGRGIEETDESMVHHRWETIDGTMEVTHSDKYTRVFIRLGEPRV